MICNKWNLPAADQKNPRVTFITVDYAPFSQKRMKNNSASRSYSVIILPALIIMQLIIWIPSVHFISLI